MSENFTFTNNYRRTGIEPSKVKPNANFTKELGADSLDVVELVIKIEYDFGDIDDHASQISTSRRANLH
jgi:acyl carrier protein